jgi:hypothetical protein
MVADSVWLCISVFLFQHPQIGWVVCLAVYVLRPGIQHSWIQQGSSHLCSLLLQRLVGQRIYYRIANNYFA